PFQGRLQAHPRRAHELGRERGRGRDHLISPATGRKSPAPPRGRRFFEKEGHLQTCSSVSDQGTLRPRRSHPPQGGVSVGELGGSFRPLRAVSMLSFLAFLTAPARASAPESRHLGDRFSAYVKPLVDLDVFEGTVLYAQGGHVMYEQ